MRIFLAGASGVIGQRPIFLLVLAGHVINKGRQARRNEPGWG